MTPSVGGPEPGLPSLASRRVDRAASRSVARPFAFGLQFDIAVGLAGRRLLLGEVDVVGVSRFVGLSLAPGSGFALLAELLGAALAIGLAWRFDAASWAP